MAELAGTTCGCCEGVSAMTPLRIENRPGLPAIARRVGTHSRFKASMLAGLSGRDAALSGLGARSDDDLSIALADGFATMADVLTFYQERIANEGYLRTSTERRSVLELARLIGYRLAPGMAAEAWLAFVLDEARAPGAPPPAPVAIDVGVRVQSVPGPDEQPQMFETVEAIEADAARNAMHARTARPQQILFGQRELTLAGTGHQLSPGDVILIVGDERARDPDDDEWDARLLQTVREDQAGQTTQVTWREGLGSVFPRKSPASENPRVHVFRQRAALFGHNAPDPRILALSPESRSALVDEADSSRWKSFGLGARSLELDQSYPKVIPESWLLLVSEEVPHRASSLPGYTELYRASTVGHASITNFGLSSRVTRIGLDSSENLDLFTRRATLVLCQSEELVMADRPVRGPVLGTDIDFDRLVEGLRPGQPLSISGPGQHVVVSSTAGPLLLSLELGGTAALAAGDRLELVAAPTADDGAGGRRTLDVDAVEAALDPLRRGAAPVLRWRLRDRDGRSGSVDAAGSAFLLDETIADTPAVPGDPRHAEVVRIADQPDAVRVDRDRTSVRLAQPLRRPYDRAAVRINGNVAAATHGETVHELLGGGDARRPNQRLPLRQSPLTFVSASTPSGRRSTLEVRVEGTRWEERSTLYGAKPGDRAYSLDLEDDARTEVVTGDGREGARLPTGQANVRARYRKGLGVAGNVKADRLTTLQVRPAGVSAVTNPEPASGGEDPETLATAREQAPLSVLTLDRAVSRQDYADFAAAFAGIAKAEAAWVPSGPRRGIALTVAGIDGEAIQEASPIQSRLIEALRAHGDPLVGLTVRSYRAVAFDLSLTVKIDPAEEQDATLARVRSVLVGAFAFAPRTFGQPVSIDEVVAVAHDARGVVAVDVDVLRRADQAAGGPLRQRLEAARTGSLDDEIQPAELLTLDPGRLTLGVMS